MAIQSSGLRTKLVRVYALQVGLISIAAVIGVYITFVIVQDVLTRQALNQEAAHFWARYSENPQVALPNTANMHGYLQRGSDQSAIPTALHNLEVGFGRVETLPDRPLGHVSQRGDDTLYLIFPQDQVSSLVFYFGLAPLIAVLLTVYALLFLTYRLSHQAVSPMINLAKALESFDFRSNSRLLIPVKQGDVDRETGLMIESLREFSDRLELFVERERTFTRNAGHELRTPLAVLKGSLDILDSRKHSEADQRVLDRIRKVSGDMETILETLLLLAREEDVHSDTPVSVNQMIINDVELLTEAASARNNRVSIDEQTELKVFAKDRVVSIIFSNLLRNAITYTEDGEINVVISPSGFSVQDTGVGISESDQEAAFTAFFRSEATKEEFEGQGLGLALVKRLCDQLDWHVRLSSTLGEGTTVTVECSPHQGLLA